MKTTVLRKVAALAVALLILLPDIAAACGICAFQQADYYVLPYTIAWSFGMEVWFFVLMMICTGEKRLSLSASPWHHFLLAVVFTFLAFFMGAAYFGPLPGLLLGFMAVITTVRGFNPQTWPTLSKGLQVGLKTVSAAAIVCILTGLVISINTRLTRSDADYIHLPARKA
jgi:hypothetical protein